MSFLKKSSSFTRFRVVDAIPENFWGTVPDKLKQFGFQEIDDIPEEQHVGWVNFDDMLDSSWRMSVPEKGEFLTFSLRRDVRRIPSAVLKKHVRIALQEEEKHIREQGKKFVGRERKKEIGEQVKLRLLGRYLPIPFEYQVVWTIGSGCIYLGATQPKIIELFLEYFMRTFELHLEQVQPYTLALALQGEEFSEYLDTIEPTCFV